MIVLDPVTLGDVAFSRASPKWVYDRTGTLVEVPANTLGVTYDPSDLSKAPYALIEPAAINLIPHSYFDGASVWLLTNASAVPASVTSPQGGNEAYKFVKSATTTSAAKIRTGGNGLTTDDLRTFSVFAKAGELTKVQLQINGYGSNYVNAIYDLTTGTQTGPRMFGTARDCSSGMINCGNGWWRIWLTAIPRPNYGNGGMDHDIFLMSGDGFTFQGDGASGLYLFGANVTRGNISSYIHSTGIASTRAADIISSTPGLIYSNVPITEPAYDAAATYAKDAAVYDPVTKLVYWSMLDANKGNPLSDPSKWNKRGATNRWAAFDDRNNTQSTSAEELLFVLSPRAIAQGLFLGNVDGSEVRVSIAVPNFGVAYSETRSLVMSTSNSSFFRWGFSRIRRRTSFLSLKLPNFYNGLVTIAIRRPGGVAKCGMCMIGPTVEPGPTLVGLSTEIKDYSTTLFNVDGSSSTIERGYRKLMSLDVVIDTESIEQAEDQMIAWRQKTAVWIGAASRPDSIICGRYSSFKKVIESYPRSKMALQIEGVLS